MQTPQATSRPIADARAGRSCFLVRCTFRPAGSRDGIAVRVRARCQGRPRRMPGVVGRRAGTLLGRHQCALAQSLRSQVARKSRLADAFVDRLVRAARTRRIRRRAARRHLAGRSGGPARRPHGRGAVRSVAPPVQRRARRSDRTLLGRNDERATRRGQRRAVLPRWLFHADPRARRHHDIERARLESRRPDALPCRHADTHGPTARRSTATAAIGSRSIAAARSCGCRRKASASPNTGCPRCARRCAHSAARTCAHCT